jgi:hypothetical protein
VAEIEADIAALKEFRDALARFRLAQRVVIAHGDQEIGKTRASLEAKARRWQAELEQRRRALDACRRAAAAAAAQAAGPYGRGGPPGFVRGGGGYAPDCSGLARDVEEAQERLKRIRAWQRRVEDEAGAFRDMAKRFRNLVDYRVPDAERHLLAIASGLEAARGIQIPGS